MKNYLLFAWCVLAIQFDLLAMHDIAEEYDQYYEEEHEQGYEDFFEPEAEAEEADIDPAIFIEDYDSDQVHSEQYWRGIIWPKILALYRTNAEDDAKNLLEACHGASILSEQEIFNEAEILYARTDKLFLAWVKSMLKIKDVKKEKTTVRKEKLEAEWRKTINDYVKTLTYAKNTAVKKLQEDLIQLKQRTIIQLRSLDQHRQHMKDTYGLKCGFFVVYNAIKMYEIIKYHIPIDGYDIFHVGVGQTLGSEQSFNRWFTQAEKALINAIQEDPSLGTYEQTTTGGTTQEAEELTTAQVLWLLSQSVYFDAAFQSMVGILEYDLQNLGEEAQGGGMTTLPSVFQTAFQYPLGGSLDEKITRFRNDGDPFFVVYLQRGHWRIFVFTVHGMYTANSYGNVSQIDDLQQIYDYILCKPIESKVTQSKSLLEEKLELFHEKLKNLYEHFLVLKKGLAELQGKLLLV